MCGIFGQLSIIDLQGGKQPMGDRGYHIVFNGEIYNYKELASSHMLGPLTSDTEVLLEMYKKYGARCLDYIDGMFSFAIHWVKTPCLVISSSSDRGIA